jgi:hypothetical protein
MVILLDLSMSGRLTNCVLAAAFDIAAQLLFHMEWLFFAEDDEPLVDRT